MKNYSGVIAGLLATIALPMLVKMGFSEACGSELTNWVMVSAVPGLLAIYKSRISQGDITPLGMRKPV